MVERKHLERHLSIEFALADDPLPNGVLVNSEEDDRKRYRTNVSRIKLNADNDGMFLIAKAFGSLMGADQSSFRNTARDVIELVRDGGN